MLGRYAICGQKKKDNAKKPGAPQTKRNARFSQAALQDNEAPSAIELDVEKNQSVRPGAKKY